MNPVSDKHISDLQPQIFIANVLVYRIAVSAVEFDLFDTDILSERLKRVPADFYKSGHRHIFLHGFTEIRIQGFTVPRYNGMAAFFGDVT